MIRIFLYFALAYMSAPNCLFTQTVNIYFGDTLYVDPSQEFWIDLRVNGFNQIPAFSFALQYDSAYIQFLGSEHPSLTGVALNPDLGLIKIAWVNGTGTGLTLIDSSILLRLHFRARQQYPTTTIVRPSTVLPIEFYQFDGISLTLLPTEIEAQVIVTRVCTVKIDLGKDKTFCSKDSIELIANCQNCSQIEWSNGIQAASVKVFTPGLYFATALAPQACYSHDSVWIAEINPPEIYLSDSVSACLDEVIILSPTISGNATLQWSNGATTLSIEAKTAGFYVVTATNADGCRDIDSIIVTIKPLPLTQLPMDTMLCKGQQLIIEITPELTAKYSWNDGTIGATASFTQSGEIVLIGIMDGCIASDTMMVLFKPLPILDLGPDLQFCDGEMVQIGVPIQVGAIYEWNTGESTPIIFTSQTAIKALRVTKDGCIASDSISILFNPLPKVDLGPNQAICSSTYATLQVNILNSTVEWSTGDVSDEILVMPPSVVTVKVNLNGCIASDTVEIAEIPTPDAIFLGEDIVVCDTAEMLLTVPFDPLVDQYLWSDGTIGQDLFIQQSGTYSVSVNHKYCVVSDTITVTFQHCQQPKIFIPNVFAPESSTKNANFGVFFSTEANIKSFEINIFDRWGSIVFQSSDPTEFWDGSIKNHSAPTGVYVYQIRIQYETEDVELRAGAVTLFR